MECERTNRRITTSFVSSRLLYSIMLRQMFWQRTCHPIMVTSLRTPSLTLTDSCLLRPNFTPMQISYQRDSGHMHCYAYSQAWPKVATNNVALALVNRFTCFSSSFFRMYYHSNLLELFMQTVRKPREEICKPPKHISCEVLAAITQQRHPTKNWKQAQRPGVCGSVSGC